MTARRKDSTHLYSYLFNCFALLIPALKSSHAPAPLELRSNSTMCLRALNSIHLIIVLHRSTPVLGWVLVPSLEFERNVHSSRRQSPLAYVHLYTLNSVHLIVLHCDTSVLGALRDLLLLELEGNSVNPLAVSSRRQAW